MSILVIDIGTSSIRAGAVHSDGTLIDLVQSRCPPTYPAQGFVEFDAALVADTALQLARNITERHDIEGVGITNQRCSTVIWDAKDGNALGPGVSWQDLRTIGTCLMLGEQGIRMAPNCSATKLSFLLDLVDADRQRDIRFGTLDTWIAWNLSEGNIHVTDATNAAVTGMVKPDVQGWDSNVLDALRIPIEVLPEIVNSSGVVGQACALPGSPPIAGIAGDQQSSLIGQGCTVGGLAKCTFGTSAALDICLGEQPPGFELRGDNGTYPIVAWRQNNADVFGLEAFIISAGASIDWLTNLGVINNAAESESVAADCVNSNNVCFVPALAGLGTPHWDFGARGTLLGLTTNTTRAEIVRAALEGIAQRAADLVEATEADSAMMIKTLRIDGGMTANSTFVQMVANACGKTVEIAPVTEATTLGAGYLAGLALGIWNDVGELASLWAPRAIVEPNANTDRQRWKQAVQRSKEWEPALSALDF